MNWIYKAYDSLRKTLRVDVLNPDYDHYIDVEHPVDLLNQTAETAFYQVLDMEGYRSAAIQLMGIWTTFTVYATLSDNATDDDETDTQWVDITNSLYGSAAFATTGTSESALLYIETLRMPHKILIKYLTASDATSGGTNSNAIDIWFRKY